MRLALSTICLNLHQETVSREGHRKSQISSCCTTQLLSWPLPPEWSGPKHKYLCLLRASRTAFCSRSLCAVCSLVLTRGFFACSPLSVGPILHLIHQICLARAGITTKFVLSRPSEAYRSLDKKLGNR